MLARSVITSDANGVITDLGFQHVENASTGANIVFTRPSAVNAVDDLMFVVVTSSSTTWRTFTIPSGWAQLYVPTGRGSTGTFYLFYKYAVTADLSTSTYTFTSNASTDRLSGTLLCQRNAVFTHGDVSASGTTPAAPAITLSYDGASVFAFYRSTNTGLVTYTTPSGYSSYCGDSDTNAPTLTVFNKTSVAAGSTGTVSTTASASSVGMLVGFSPKDLFPGLPTYVGYNYVNNADSTTDAVTINVPSGTANGDIMLAFTSSGSTAFTAPSGWTQIYNTSNGAGMTAWYRVASSEPSNYTFTCNSSVTAITAGCIVTFRNGAYDTAGSAVTGADPQNHTVTTTGKSAVVVGFATQRGTNAYTSSTAGATNIFNDSASPAPVSVLEYVQRYEQSIVLFETANGSSSNSGAIAVSIKAA